MPSGFAITVLKFIQGVASLNSVTIVRHFITCLLDTVVCYSNIVCSIVLLFNGNMFRLNHIALFLLMNCLKY